MRYNWPQSQTSTTIFTEENCLCVYCTLVQRVATKLIIFNKSRNLSEWINCFILFRVWVELNEGERRWICYNDTWIDKSQNSQKCPFVSTFFECSHKQIIVSCALTKILLSTCAFKFKEKCCTKSLTSRNKKKSNKKWHKNQWNGAQPNLLIQSFYTSLETHFSFTRFSLFFSLLSLILSHHFFVYLTSSTYEWKTILENFFFV